MTSRTDWIVGIALALLRVLDPTVPALHRGVLA